MHAHVHAHSGRVVLPPGVLPVPAVLAIQERERRGALHVTAALPDAAPGWVAEAEQ